MNNKKKTKIVLTGLAALSIAAIPLTNEDVMAKPLPQYAYSVFASSNKKQPDIQPSKSTNNKKQPSTPPAPTTPKLPNRPSNPKVPEVPEEPSTPEVPEEPSTPEVPEEPEVPEVPETPEDPSIPENPVEQTEVTLDTGLSIHNKIFNLIGVDSSIPGYDDYTIGSYVGDNTIINNIAKSETAPTIELTDNNIISTNDSKTPVYIWIEGNTLYWYSEAEAVYLNEDSSYIFFGLQALTDISGIENWNTSNIKNFSYAFTTCKKLTDISALSNWDMSNVEDYTECLKKTAITDASAIGTWVTPNCKTVNGMLYGISTLTDISALANWDVSNVEELDYLFYGCSKIADYSALTDWNTSNVTCLYKTFQSNYLLTDLTPLAKWDTSKVESFCQTFLYCKGITDLTPLKNWKFNNIKYSNHLTWSDENNCYISSIAGTFQMFKGCTSLTTLDGIESWDMSNNRMFQYMFYDCTALADVSAIDNWNISMASMYGSSPFKNMFYHCLATPDWNGTFDEDGTFTPAT